MIIEFSESELKVIERFLINRIVAIREIEISQEGRPMRIFKKPSPFSLVAKVDLLDKIQSGISDNYNSRELVIIQTCVKEGLRPLVKKVIQLGNAGLEGGSAAERDCKLTINAGKSVLLKIRFYTTARWKGINLHFMFPKLAILLMDIIQRPFKTLFHKTQKETE